MKVIIVGGVAGGASAAARLRRLDEAADIVIYERGEYISFANCGLPYHIGGIIAERGALLVQTPESMRARFAVDVRTRHEVTAIRPDDKVVTVRNLVTGESFEDGYDWLILSPGAKPLVPPIPGVAHPRVFTLRNIPDMDRIRAKVDAGARSAVVVGGGYIGVEMAENLVERGVAVTLVEMADQVLTFLDPDLASHAHDELRRHGVALRLRDRVVAFEHGTDGAVSVVLGDGSTLATDLVVLAIGVVPETDLAKGAGLRLGPTGAIAVDAQMRTSHPSILAVGDAVEVTHFVAKTKAKIPLAGPANRQARIAANIICGIASSYKDTQGTSIIKVFDLACAATGASSALLRASGTPFRTVTVHAASHASYYPSASPVHLKLLFSPDDGRLLGAQACGIDGVDKRIDVLATALRHGATVYDVEDYELAYAPPFGAAKDPVNMAAFVAVNHLRGLGPVVDAEGLRAELQRGVVLLDVRTRAEQARGRIEGAIEMPLNELRARLGELPKDKPVIVYCAAGLRGYIAQRILLQNGLAAANLTGGYTSYLAWKGSPQDATEPFT